MPSPLALFSISKFESCFVGLTLITIINAPKTSPIPIPIRIFLSLKKLNTSFILNINLLLIVLPPYQY